MQHLVPIGFENESLQARALAIAEQYHLLVDNQTLPRLCVTEEQLVLLMPHFSPLSVDFSTDAWKKRRDAGKQQGLIRACKPKPGLRILDATAGWGRDAAILASFGATVVMLERQPIMAALLADGLARMPKEAPLPLSLTLVDAMDYLQVMDVDDYPDVIYLDPMHPSRQKSALVKKDMQALQELIGADDDVVAVIQEARRRVRQRVVVKWPQRLAPVLPSSSSITGKTIRFDSYLPVI